MKLRLISFVDNYQERENKSVYGLVGGTGVELP